MKAIAIALVLLLAQSTQVGAQSPTPPIIELRIALTSARPGYAPRKLADTTFYVSDSVLFSDVDLERADTLWSEGMLSVRFQLTSAAAARLGAMTKDPVGDRIAFLFNGELTTAVQIVSPISSRRGEMEIVGPPKALPIAAQIVARWPKRN